ncbi:MAG: VWA domain-containing protein [Myxococcales bacterium]|nr:VWA domain-containing protein [Myxococcales bacterium]
MHQHRIVAGVIAVALACASTPALAQNLTVDNTTITLGGKHRYQQVRVINGGRIVVPTFNGSDKVNTGNLEIVADSIVVDATSSIVADGKGYQARLCNDGSGPTATAGGRGGCSVRDSGGGGAHFGRGGRGTKDCFIFGSATQCEFPQEFEENCGSNVNGSCVNTPGTCYNNDALPTVAGQAYKHSIYEIEFGAAGGDKGCRDGDGAGCTVGGAGGGRIALVAVNAGGSGGLDIQGRVSAEGMRGCGYQNDSGGGGGGGSILLIGDQVNVSATAYVSAAGGLGGDTQGNAICPPCAQSGGTCDDCGGGGGGGIISVLSGVPAQLASRSVFNVAGAEGGTCTICKGEAGGGAGELQLSGAYLGEICDGYDNDFDGQVDEGLGNVTCGTPAACQTTVPLCATNADPKLVFVNDCVPQSTAQCKAPLADNRSRFMVIVDTSGSMLTNLSGVPTFGDGSQGHAGVDTDGNGTSDDSRLYKAKSALTQVISAFPEIDFGLARFAQDVDSNIACQLAHWFECAGLCCTYDDPRNNTGGAPRTGACTLSAGAAGNLTVQTNSPGEECINYAGKCGLPRRGADIIVGFQKPILQKLMWLDNKETNFNTSTTEGNHCNYAGGGDCELRGTGPTPLAGSLQSVEAFLKKEKAADSIASCRKYGVILLTDGSETCDGNPTQAAADLLSKTGTETFVIGFSVLPSEQASLNAIAHAGSTSGTRNAFFVGNEQQLAAALAAIVGDSVAFEKCNNLDDDCDTLIDEDFPLKGKPCDNGLLGVCRRTGVYVCAADGSGTVCNAPTATGTPEVCNGLDDDCDGQVDEDIPGGCTPCVPTPEVCNGKDDNCNGQVDENIPSGPCGANVGVCSAGTTQCVNGQLTCVGGSTGGPEQCDGLDNDCDGTRDNFAETCYPFTVGCDKAAGTCVGQCRLGTRLCTAVQQGGNWTGQWSQCTGAVGPSAEVCDGIDNNCDGQVDEKAECPGNSQCIQGQCTRQCSGGEFVCPSGQICKDGWCVRDECDKATCEAQGPGFICRAGNCIDACASVTCPKFETCERGTCVDKSCFAAGCPAGQACIDGKCEKHPCEGVSCADGQFCSDGKCLDLCAPGRCTNLQKCVVENGSTKCVDDPCAGKVCGQDRVCVDGNCVLNTCSPACQKDERCIGDKCVKDACNTTTCPSGYRCELGNCLPVPQDKRELLATGAGGCSCRAAGGEIEGPPLGLLFFLALLLVRRRRR